MKRAIHIHVHDGAWEESKHPRKDDGKFGSGSSDGGGKQIDKDAAAIAAMSDEKRDNTEIQNFPGGGPAYDLYEARKLAPKPAGKLKRITDANSFSLWQGYDYVANVDGAHYGITKQDDPDDDAEDEDGNRRRFVYSFQPLDDPRQNVDTLTDDKDELFKAMREHRAKSQHTLKEPT